jgi:uncharacterized protein (TIGR00297 family)
VSWWISPPVAPGLALGAGLAAVISFVAWRRDALAPSGAWCAIGIGALTVGFGGLALGVAMVVFFVTSVGVGRLWAGRRRAPRRDGWQVLANGAAAALLAAAGYATGQPVLAAAAFGAVAGANADTWASEVGAGTGGRTWRLLPPGEVAPGDNGGVSLAGTLASAAGAGLIGAIALLASTPAIALAVCFGGFTGAVLDSVLGGWLEPRPGHAGRSFYDNNLNNALATAAAGLVTALAVTFN